MTNIVLDNRPGTDVAHPDTDDEVDNEEKDNTVVESPDISNNID